MRCHEAEELLAPQLAEGLDAATQRELALHLESCAVCRAKLQQEYELDRLIVAAVTRHTPAAGELGARIRERLDQSRGWRPRLLQWRWPAFAGAAALVLLCAVAISRFSAPSSMHLLCQDAVDDHRSEVVLREPRRWHTASNEISELARQTVPEAQIPRQVAGMTLEKGRICGLLDATALHLVYSNGSQEVSVFFMLRRQLPADSLPPVTNLANRLHRESEAGIAVTSFADDGMGVVVVGNPQASRLLAEQLVRSL